MYTRTDLRDHAARRREVERREGTWLAVLAVGLGVAQLALLPLLDGRVPRHRAVAVEGGAFVAYVAVVAWRMVVRQRRLLAVTLTCPACGQRLQDLSERIAIASGHCDKCGGCVAVDAPGST